MIIFVALTADFKDFYGVRVWGFGFHDTAFRVAAFVVRFGVRLGSRCFDGFGCAFWLWGFGAAARAGCAWGRDAANVCSVFFVLKPKAGVRVSSSLSNEVGSQMCNMVS